MQKRLTTRILKAKNRQNQKIEDIIEEFIHARGAEAKEQSKKFLSDLIVLILKDHNIPKEELAKIIEVKLKSFGFKTDSEELEDIYTAFAVASLPKVKFVFDKVDTKAVEAMYKNFFWLEEDASENLQADVRKVLKEAFEGKIEVDKVGAHLRDKFGGITEESERYFQGVSDHILRQSQSIARVKQYEKNGIQYVQIDAVMDNKTSDICRSMNGRVIAVGHLTKQSDKIMEAKSVDEKKKSSEWRSKPFLGASTKLPSNFGLPPYHFRCRTGVKPYFDYPSKIDGMTVRGSKIPGDKHDGETVAFSHMDKTGKEIIVTDKDYAHINSIKHKIPKKDIIKALNSIEETAVNIGNKKRVSVRTSNGYYISLEGNKIVTMFKPDRGLKNYFDKNSVLKQGQERNIIKWLKELFY